MKGQQKLYHKYWANYATCHPNVTQNYKILNTYRYYLLNLTPEEIRTPDLLVRSQTLYPAELRAHIIFLRLNEHPEHILSNFYINKKSFFFKFFIKILKTAIKLILKKINMLSFLKRGKNMQKLTQREKTILKLITEGYCNTQISEKVYVSIHTVKAHISSIIRKLDAKNRTNAVYIAITNNILDE